MAKYSYVATDSSGKAVRGTLTASNDLDLEERLAEQGLVIISHKLMRDKGTGIRLRKKISAKDLIMFCVHLEQLDRAGVPLLDSLSDMRDSVDTPAFRDLMSDLYENVKNGDLLSEAMAKRPEVFDEVFRGLVASGEHTGELAGAFKHLADHLRWNAEFRRKVKKAIMYPIILIVVMSLVMTVMMNFVVPKIVEFLVEQGFDLPWYTRALIATSEAFQNYWYVIFGIPIGIIFFIIITYKKSAAMKYRYDKIFLSLPFIGPVILKINMARFTRFFSITFASGIGVLECLQTGRDVVGNAVIKESIEQIILNVSEGNSITRSIQITERFPNLVIRMFKVGEDSGNMEDALEHINYFYDREVDDAVNAMVEIIQPVLTAVMGVLMLWVIAAVFKPLYDSFSKMDI